MELCEKVFIKFADTCTLEKIYIYRERLFTGYALTIEQNGHDRFLKSIFH